VPVGVINVTWGGTPIEAHMSREANHSLPYYGEALNEIAAKQSTDSLIIDKRKATPQLPATVFNAMINPVVPFGLKAFFGTRANITGTIRINTGNSLSPLSMTCAFGANRVICRFILFNCPIPVESPLTLVKTFGLFYANLKVLL
jgi:hypothetical protein